MAIAHPNDHPQSPRHRREPRGPTRDHRGPVQTISDRRREPRSGLDHRGPMWSDAVQTNRHRSSLRFPPPSSNPPLEGRSKNRPRPSPSARRIRRPTSPISPISAVAIRRPLVRQSRRRHEPDAGPYPPQRRPEQARKRPSAPFRKNGKNGRPESENVKAGATRSPPPSSKSPIPTTGTKRRHTRSNHRL